MTTPMDMPSMDMPSMDTVELGASGLKVSRLSFGTGTIGGGGRSQQSDLGLEGLSSLLLYAYDRGITFWDGADGYGTHEHLAKALAQVERSTVTLTTKTTSRNPENVAADVERFLRELKTDYIDIVLLHCLTSADWPETATAAMEQLDRCKQRGLIRAVGTSCHDLGALTASASSNWPDVNLVRINYAGAAMCGPPDQVRELIEQMVLGGKGVYGMKVVGGGGDLTRDPARAIQYVAEQTRVHAMVMGMTSRAQVDENAGLVQKFSAVGV